LGNIQKLPASDEEGVGGGLMSLNRLDHLFYLLRLLLIQILDGFDDFLFMFGHDSPYLALVTGQDLLDFRLLFGGERHNAGTITKA